MLSHEDGERDYLHSMTRGVWDYGSRLGFQIFLFLVMKFTYPSRKWPPSHTNSFISTLFYYWWPLATLPLLYNILHMSLHLHCLLLHLAGANPTENSITKQRQTYCHTSVFYLQIYHVLDNILATSHEELTHWKRPWCWEGLGVGEEGDDRRWDGWMVLPTIWTWIWVNSRS